MPFNLDKEKPDLPLRLFLYTAKIILDTPPGRWVNRTARQALNGHRSDTIELTRIELVLPRLGKEFHTYRIAQISDFHIGTRLDAEQLHEAIVLVNQQEADLVAITGDFVTCDPEKYADELVSNLRSLNARDGIVAVLGNHDHWTDASIIRRVLNQAGVIELNNKVLTLQRGSARLHLSGVDDMMNDMDDLPAVLEAIPEDGAAILLAHEPDYATLSSQSGRFDLQISGHTHGGQVRLPIIGAILLPKYGRRFPSGLYEVNGMYQYTNRGLGTAELQVRYNCRPEITIFELKSASVERGKPDSF